MKKAKGFFASRGFSSGVVTALVIAMVIVANIIIYTLTALFGLYIYSPLERDYGITGVTDSLFREAEEKGETLTVTFLSAKDDVRNHVTGSYVLETAEAYAEKYSFVDLKFVNLLTKMDDDNKIVRLEKYQTDMRGNPVELRTHSIIFSYGEGSEENYKVLTDTYSTAGYADFYTLDNSGTAYAYNGEEVFAAMMSWVLHEEHKVVYFTENHGETIDVSFSNLLASAGYYVDVINLRNEWVPTGEDSEVAFVAISNPISDFEKAEGSDYKAEIQRLESYLDKGGKLYVAIDPYGPRLDNLEGLLAEYGIVLSGKDGEYGYSRELVVDPSEAIAIDGMSFIASFGTGTTASAISNNFKEYTSGRVLLSEVAKLELDSSKGAEALLLSSPSSRILWEGDTVSESGNYAVCAASTKDEAGGLKSTVFVSPTVLMTNADLLVAGGYSNKDFMYSTLHELFDSATAIYGTKSIMYDSGIVENLTQRSATVYTVILLLIPVALAVTGAVVVIRRKRR